MRAMCSTAIGQSFKNVPNDYIDVLSVNQVNAAGRGRTASDVQGEQVGMKKARHRPSGHALPFEWQIVALGGAQRQLVTRVGKPA